MSLILNKNNLSPSIAYTFTINGTPVDLTGSAVKFRMRRVGETSFTTDEDALIVDAAAGQVRFDPVAGTVADEGDYLGWFRVTFSNGKSQDAPEFVIEVRDHAPETNGYIELEELKTSTELTSTSFADMDLQNAIIAASRSVDLETSRRFYPDTVDQTRYYTPNGQQTIPIDDLISLTSLGTDTDDDGVAEYTWTEDTDFVLEPRNAPLDGFPYTSVRRLTYGNYLWPGSRTCHDFFRDSVIVTGRFGWASPPANIKVATTMLAARFVKRMREAPFGVAGFDATGATVRISQTDPDVMRLLAPYTRRTLFV